MATTLALIAIALLAWDVMRKGDRIARLQERIEDLENRQ